MIGDQFFPTPPEVISIMFSGLDFKYHRTFLDPSAGEGHILDAITDKYRDNRYHHHDDKIGLYAIEIDPGRQAILRDKDYSVIDSDFLLYPGHQYFDFIVMNPPFDEGAKHLLKAFEIANGATIRCLINSETLNNPYTEERKRLESVIKQYGWSKDLGQVFRDAERKTDVFVTLVHLQDTRKKESFRLKFKPTKLNRRFKVEDIEDNALVSPNVFAAYEVRYNAGVAAFKKLLLARQEVDFFLEPLLSEYDSGQKLVGEALKSSQGADVSYEKFLKAMTKAAWSNLFAKTKLGDVVTESVRKELQKMQSQQGVMAFTASNMEALFNQLFVNREEIMENCIVDAFQEICKWYHENRIHVEGYKTNSSYKVGKRFILPNMGATWSEGVSYDGKRKISDIEKSLCFLTGKRLEGITSLTTVYDNDSHYGKKMQSEFFITKLYKRGTLHFLWKDFDLMNRFNMVAGQKLWGNRIPENTKAGAYE